MPKKPYRKKIGGSGNTTLDYLNSLFEKQKKKQKKSTEDFMNFLEKNPEFLTIEEKCKSCKGEGRKIEFERGISGYFRSNDVGVCETCDGKCKINKMQRFHNETIEHIKKRVIKNFNANNRWSTGDIDDLIFAVLKGFNGGKRNVDKNIIYYGQIEIEGKKIGPKHWQGLAVSSIGNFIVEQWKKSKSKNYKVMLEICLQYLAREPTQKQRTMIREKTGISKNWNKLNWDYYECYEKLSGDEKFSIRASLEAYVPTKKEVSSQLDFVFKRNKLSQKQIDVAVKKIIREQKDKSKKISESFWQNCMDQLATCISADLPGYRFNEKEIQSIHTRAAEYLHKKLKESKSKSALNFVNSWVEWSEKRILHHANLIDDPRMLENLKNKLFIEKHPFEKLKPLLKKDGENFKFRRDEYAELEWKAGIYANRHRCSEDCKHLKTNPHELPLNEFINLQNKNVQKGILKTIIAFLNTSGGKLIIGVDDNTRKIVGFGEEKDVFWKENNIQKEKQTIEKFEDDYARKIGDILEKQPYISDHMKTDYVKTENITCPDDTVIHLIEVDKTPEPRSYLINEGEKIPYIRKGSKSVPIKDPEAWAAIVKKGNS